MRILFTFVGGNGHLQPLLPTARAARAAGHTVAFCCPPTMVSTVAAAGFEALPVGEWDGAPPPRLPLVAVSTEHEDQVLRDVFAGRVARDRAVGVGEACARWRPDVLACEELDFGGVIAAERRGLPYANVLVIAAGNFVRPGLLAEPLDAVRAQFGLPADPTLAALRRYLVIAPQPPSFRDPAFPLPAGALAVRPAGVGQPDDSPVPAWARTRPGAPTVYFTLGTVFNLESGDLFGRVLAGLRELPVNLLVTVGREVDPAELGPQPEHVHIERYLPQETVLPHCAAVVSQAGSGAVIGALAHGLPMVLIPMGADQPQNAARAADLGVATVLDPLALTPALVADAVTTILADPSYRLAADRIRAEVATLPDPSAAIPLLEQLATTHPRPS